LAAKKFIYEDDLTLRILGKFDDSKSPIRKPKNLRLRATCGGLLAPFHSFDDGQIPIHPFFTAKPACCLS
jgi:hypothetical protein